MDRDKGLTMQYMDETGSFMAIRFHNFLIDVVTIYKIKSV